MTEIARYLSDDEATVVQAALEPFKQSTFTFRGRGSFAQFARLPSEVRFAINYNLTEHGNLLDQVVIYAEPKPMRGSVYYVLGITPDKKLMAFHPLLNPPTLHVIWLAKERTKPWSAWAEIKSLRPKDVAGLGFCLVLGIAGLLRFGFDDWSAYLFLALGLVGLSNVFVWAPLRHHFRRLRVLAALNRMAEPPTPAMPSAESIIRSKGGTFGPEPA